MIERRVDRRGELAAAQPHRVHRTRLHECLEHPLVDETGIDHAAQLVQGLVAPLLFAGLEHRLDGGLTDVLDRGETEADLPLRHGEIEPRAVDVRRQHLDAHPAALGDVVHELVGVRLFRREQRREEVHRVVHLQPGRVVGDQRIGRGVRLVEAVSREVSHEIEDLLGRRRRNPLLLGPVAEAHGLGFHHLFLLLAHRAPQDVRVAQRVAGHRRGDLHHLLLVDDHPVGFAQDRLQQLVRVAHLDLAVAALDEVFDQPAAERTGPVERVQRHQVAEPLRLQLAQDLLHPARLELEDPVRLGAAEQLVDRRIVQRKRVEIRLLPGRVTDRAQRVVDQRQGLETEEIQLEQADLLDLVLGELRRDLVLLFRPLVERRELDDRTRARSPHRPRGSRRGVSGPRDADRGRASP